jgi:hypothetical protein
MLEPYVGGTCTYGSEGGWAGRKACPATRRAPGMARSAMDGAGNRKAKADREVT